MSRPENRLQLMDRLGATQVNHVWAWCGVNHDERKVYFSVWTDFKYAVGPKGTYVLQGPDWGLDGSPNGRKSRNDHDAKFALVFEQGYESWGYFNVVKDPTASPREIEETKTGFVMKLDISKLEDGCIIGTVVERVEVR